MSIAMEAGQQVGKTSLPVSPLLLASAVATLLVIGAACAVPRAEPASSKPPTPLNVKRGIGFWPTDSSPAYVEGAFSMLLKGAEIAAVQKWDPFDRRENAAPNALFDHWLDRAAGAGLAKYVALEPFDEERKALRLPDEWRGGAPDLSNPVWQAAYREKVVQIAQRHHPEYLNVAVEANMYYQHHPEDWEAFRDLMRSLRDAVKQVAPSTKVFCSYQYEVLQGIFPGKSPRAQWELLAEQAVEQDLLGISSYPLFLTVPYEPLRVQATYFQDLAARSRLPVFVAEIGWYSSPNVEPASSAGGQAAFVARLPELFSGLNVEAVCWISLCDLKRVLALRTLEKNLPQFFSLALLDERLQPKPAWDVWCALRASDSRPETGAEAAQQARQP